MVVIASVFGAVLQPCDMSSYLNPFGCQGSQVLVVGFVIVSLVGVIIILIRRVCILPIVGLNYRLVIVFVATVSRLFGL